MNKVDKFYDIKNFLQCPICGKKIRFHAGGLVCKREHRFDISSKGYVNFLQSSKQMKGYDLEFFESRQRFLEAGYYDHIAEAVISGVLSHKPLDVVVDAGCGEGFYSSQLAQRIDAQVLAFDIASVAIKAAARREEPVKWMVADITNIPVKDHTVDCILDIFTPANYGEFARVLKDDGTVIKVIPGKNHMAELREAAGQLIRSQEYTAGEEVLDYFAEHFEIVRRVSVSRTAAISSDLLRDLVQMTPLLFDVDKSKLDLNRITEITVEGEVLTGKNKK